MAAVRAHSVRPNCRQGEGNMRNRDRGFTLIELLVVIAIIAILAAILFPVFIRAKAAAQKSGCISNLREIDYAYKMYLADYQDFYPSNDYGANLFLVDPYMKGQRKFKPDSTGQGTEKSVWLCPGAAGKMGMWYFVQMNYWVTKQNTPWYKLGIDATSCRVYVSYVVNNDVTSAGPGPASLGKVRQPSRVVFFAEGCYNPDREPGLGTTPTALHPSASGDPNSSEVTSGWYPGYPSTNSSNIEIRHNNGSNFLYVDSHVQFNTSVPPLDRWKVPGTL